eukprot:3451798-Pleurochrysis_carterae.AAC.1
MYVLLLRACAGSAVAPRRSPARAKLASLICALSPGWPAPTMYAACTPLRENGVWHRSYPTGMLPVH